MNKKQKVIMDKFKLPIIHTINQKTIKNKFNALN